MRDIYNNKFSLLPRYLMLLLLFTSYSCAETDYLDEKLITLQDKTFAILPGNDFKLDASSGDVIISSWNKDQVHVKILGNDKAKEKVEISFNDSENLIEVQAKYDWSLFTMIKGLSLKFEIQIPKKFNVEVYTAGGDIKLQNVEGNVVLKTSGGDINLSGLNGNTEVSTSGGDIKFSDTYGNAELSTSGGDINGNKFSGKIIVSTSGGDISLAGKDATIEASTSGGDISLDYSGQNQGIELSTSGGDITAKFPKDLNASAMLSAFGGEIRSDFSGNNAIKITSTNFEADINSGGNPLIMKTSGGDIILKKK